MTASEYERLSAQDASFLLFEGPNNPMNVGGTSIFDAGTLVRPDGGVDFERIKRHVASRLHAVPRYRQRLAYVPVENRPAWIDDDRFDLDYHVRHAALPRPGDESQLKRLSADILTGPLDRSRALWEMWVVEGLQGRRFATVTKAHHCMIDGVSGVDLSAAMMSLAPRRKIEAPRPWRPKRPPSGVELLRDEVLERLRLPSAEPVRRAATGLLRSDLGGQMSAVWDALQAGLRGASETVLNRPTGPHRRFDWLQTDLDQVKAIKNRLGGTVNDVVLACVSGAVRRFLRRRRVRLGDAEFRAAVPVDVRGSEDRHKLGNRVSVWLTRLPVEERDPRRRLARVWETTMHLKKGQQAQGADALIRFAEWTGSRLLSLGVRFAARMNPYNLIVTNVRGPQFPLYLLDARLLQGYPLVPLFENQDLGIAIFSYDGRLCWGFNADWDQVPDLANFVDDVKTSFAELREAAGAPAARQRHGSVRRGGSRRRKSRNRGSA